MKSAKWIDISVPLTNGMLHWPGDPDVQINKISSIENGDGANITGLSLSAHTGTHMDAPLHFINEGKDISEINFEAVVGNAKVINIRNENVIDAKELEQHSIMKGDRILFKTKNSEEEWFNNEFKKQFVYLTNQAAEYLSKKEIALVGIDYLSIAEFSKGAQTHQILLSSEIWILEGIFLKDVQEGDYELICMPLRIPGSDGSPARAIIRKTV